ncbi:iron-hydroxamate ABC transporter substrate-binding protein [Lihuaxuella thermophila]|uniref:Iron complex transport system substrate-binding protein n=1 Tax=Lihuaxuella thermophila TaxID=1173111 RepID=A0A1H8IKT3_9BACL|nr:iron-hydroxamate ABC transporter substrate-binding protein [Lihuaxuella thermophila]SEN69500.1 iron complex transport system substrate-binding protein [Lihuaxuella thermophila]
MKTNKKHMFLSLIAVLLVGLLAACANQTSQISNSGTTSNSSAKTRIYHSENGDIEVPANPKRIAVLAATYSGNLLKLGIKPIAVNEWQKKIPNKFYEGKLDDVEVVTPDSLEKLVELNPDLIITFSTDKNIKKYSEIAPTVVLTYEKYNYLEQHIEIGKIVGKEKEARAWVEEWKKKAEAARKKVQEAIGKDATALVLESYGKEMYIYGKNWGRGTEVIYQALGIKAPEKVKQDVFGRGYKAISTEMIPQYAGDYIFVGVGAGNNSFMETDVWKGIPAVQKNQVIKFDSNSFYYNDPISLEKEMEFIVQALTKK